jgi:serine O-acetyltransferase
MPVSEKLISMRRFRLARAALVLLGIDFPAQVKVGKNLRMVHHGLGTVIYPRTTIGDNVRIYHQVTLGRKDAHIPIADSKMEQLVIGDDVVIFPGAKVLAGDGVTTIGAGTIVAANAVLMNSTGPKEVWAGVPARKLPPRSI